MKLAIIMHKASLDSCALSLVEILEQTKAITINPFFLEHNGHIKCGARTPFQGPGGSWLFSPETGDTETLKKSPGTAERMASLSPIKSNLATVAKIYQDLREAPKTHPYCKRVADMSHKNA